MNSLVDLDSPSTHASLPEDYSTLIREETTSLAQDTAEKILETSTTDQESALLSTGQSVDSFSYLTDSTTQDDSLGITSLSERRTYPFTNSILSIIILEQGQSITEETIISILEKEHEEGVYLQRGLNVTIFFSFLFSAKYFGNYHRT